MPERIVAMYVAHGSGKEKIDGSLSRRTIKWLRRALA
jgi:hypothetical protein